MYSWKSPKCTPEGGEGSGGRAGRGWAGGGEKRSGVRLRRDVSAPDPRPRLPLVTSRVHVGSRGGPAVRATHSARQFHPGRPRLPSLRCRRGILRTCTPQRRTQRALRGVHLHPPEANSTRAARRTFAPLLVRWRERRENENAVEPAACPARRRGITHISYVDALAHRARAARHAHAGPRGHTHD